MDRLVDTISLARELRISRTWLADEADAGRLPCLRAGRRRLFSYEAVTRALAARAAEEMVDHDAEQL